MDQAITRATLAMPAPTPPVSAAPRLVGEFQGFVDGIEPSIRWLDRKNMPQVGDRLFAIPAHAAAARAWSILLTSANHGTVGPLGSTFPHAGEHHERVVVVEVPASAGAPSDQVNLVLRAAPAAEAGASTVLTDERIIGIARYQALREPMNSTAIAFARAIEREVAAQAGQNCLLSWGGKNVQGDEASIKAVKVALHDAGTVPELKDRIRELQAQAGQVAVPGWISVDERLPDAGHCLATYRNQHGKLRIIRAKYARQFEIDADEDAIDQGNCEYNEADDTFYLKAGWLECIDNWDDYSSIYVTEGEVTHWMPLPAVPSPAKESK